MVQSHRGVNHLKIKEQIEKNNEKTAHMLSFAMEDYDVDFTSRTFGQIRIKKLSTPIPTEDIKIFFQEFHQAPVIVITVKDKENPTIDGKNEIILEFKKHERRLPCALFRALLSKGIKDVYKKRYPDNSENNRYKRLENLICDFSGREIRLGEYKYENT